MKGINRAKARKAVANLLAKAANLREVTAEEVVQAYEEAIEEQITEIEEGSNVIALALSVLLNVLDKPMAVIPLCGWYAFSQKDVDIVKRSIEKAIGRQAPQTGLRPVDLPREDYDRRACEACGGNHKPGQCPWQKG